MKTFFDCVPCFIRQALDALRMIEVSEEATERILRLVLLAAAEVEMDQSPPAMGRVIHRIIREETGSSDPYREIKARSTRRALDSVPVAEERIAAAPNPLRASIRFAIAGNVMDFALPSHWDGDRVERSLEAALSKPLDEEALAVLEQALAEASSILVLGDNAGEAVFDRLMIERFPPGKTTYAVKGSPVINDVVREDALAAGLDRVAEIVDNGSDAPGTILDICSPQFRRRFQDADLVIAKGQANYETLCGQSRPVWFLTQVKCPVIARDLKAEVGDWIVSPRQPEVELAEQG